VPAYVLDAEQSLFKAKKFLCIENYSLRISSLFWFVTRGKNVHLSLFVVFWLSVFTAHMF